MKVCRKTVLGAAGTNGIDAVSRKPPMGRRDASTPPPVAPPAGVLVRRSQVCLSTFYKECAESADSELDCSFQSTGRDGRLVPLAGSKVKGHCRHVIVSSLDILFFPNIFDSIESFSIPF